MKTQYQKWWTKRKRTGSVCGGRRYCIRQNVDESFIEHAQNYLNGGFYIGNTFPEITNHQT